jgi:hypothetical protein
MNATIANQDAQRRFAEACGSAYRTWYIKVAYTFGEPRTIGHTVRARNQEEAERKAAKLVQGKCVGFAVYTPNAQAQRPALEMKHERHD